MNFTNVSIFLSLIFAPSFVLSIHYYNVDTVAFVYAIFMLFYLLTAIIFKGSLKNISTPLIYFSFILMAYIFTSFQVVKVIPALISLTFFIIFLIAYIQDKKIILSFTRKFYKKEIDQRTIEYLGSSDGYWAIILLINTSIQTGFIFYNNHELWAFYSSVGWYIYLFFAFILQVIYEKIFIKRMII